MTPRLRDNSKSESGDSDTLDIRSPEAARTLRRTHSMVVATPTSTCLTVRSRCFHHRRMPCDTSRAPPSSSPPSPAAARTLQVTQPRSRICSTRGPAIHRRQARLARSARRAGAWPSTPRAGWPAGPTSRMAPGARRSGRTDRSIPIGTLGGPSSTVPWPGLNDAGMVVGISQTGESDPLHEDWSCELGGFLLETTDLICRGFVWQNGVTRELPPLGGHHSFATGVNSRGDVVGWAETAVHDPTCVDAQVLQFRAVLWDPKDGSKGKIKARAPAPVRRRLGIAPPRRSTTRARRSASRAIATRRVGRFSAKHAVLWEPNGKATRDPQPGRHDLAHADGHQRPGRRRRVLQSARRRRSRGRVHLARLPLGLRRGYGR